MEIRNANKNDFEQYYDLHKNFVKDYRKLSKYNIPILTKKLCLKDFKTRFGKNKIFFVAEEGNRIVGYLLGSIERSIYGNSGYLEDFFVSRKYQNRGLATRLKDRFFEWLKKRKIRYCRLDVNPENEKAIQIYKKWGFKIYKYRMTKKI